MRTSSLRIVVFAFLLFSSDSLRALGQESSNGDNSVTRTNPSKSSNAISPEKPEPLTPRPGDWQIVKDKTGQLIPAQYAPGYLEWLKEKRTAKDAEVRPLYSFSDVSLEGTTTDDEATLTISLSLQITEESKWVRVPLGLNEAVLLKGFEHEYKPASAKEQSSNKGQAEFASYNRRTTGYEWWFQGKGQHILTLKSKVSLKKTTGVRRLQLAVPTAASSYLRLTIPIALEQLSLETVAGGVHKTKSVGKQSTEVEIFRLGQQLDLGWQALPDSRQVETLLDANTEIRVELTEETILLKTRQLIYPHQGSMKELEVSLPGGFKILELKVDGERRTLSDEDLKANQPVKISLPAATTNRLSLEWILQAPWPETGQFLLEGFHVSGADRQSGTIEIYGLEGYRITKGAATGVIRTNAPTMAISAYEISQQPFQLVLELQQIQPSYSIHPHLFLKMGEQEIEMLVDLELQVFRGVVRSLELDWQEFAEQGWRIDQAELPGIVEQMETDPNTGHLRILLGKRITQNEPSKPLRLRANRMVEHPEEEFPLSLPRVIASDPKKLVSTVVVITNRENVESRVTPLEETETRPLSANFAEEVEQLLKSRNLRDFRGPRQQSFLVSSREHQFRASIATQPQSVRCETRVRVIVDEEESAIEQELNFDVKYEPATKLRVMVPETFPSQVQFSMGPVPIPFEWTGVKVGRSREAVLQLPEPMLNQVSLSARYPMSEVDQEKLRLDLPLVRASEVERISGRFEFTSDYQPEVTVQSSQWKKSTDAQGLLVWTSSLPGESLSVKWSARQESDIQDLNISKSLIQSTIQRNGQVYSLAHYLLDRPVEHLLISLPPDQILPDAFYWNGRELSEFQVSRVNPEKGTYRLELSLNDSRKTSDDSSPAEADQPELAIAYHTPSATPMNWGQDFRLASPTFPGDVWAEKTQWEVTLPVDQHLFSLPQEFTPEFSWVRQGVIWSRVSHDPPETSHSWLTLTDDSPMESPPNEGNTYRFSYFGPCPPLHFSTMNRSIVVLFGAGLALFIGFLLLKIPATRNVLTILLAIFGFALCSIWYAAPMQLLSQPAALGLLLAIIAVLMDRSFKRQSGASVPLSTPQEFHGSTAHPLPGYPEPIGSEDPTAVRPLHEKNSDSAPTPQITGRGSTASPVNLIGSSYAEKSE